MLRELDTVAVRRWAAAAVDLLAAHRDEIDRINVFPVADADTGTNLLATMRAAFDELRRDGGGGAGDSGGDGVGRQLASLARGALLGGRGNSGLVLGQLLRGLAQECPDRGALTAAALCDGLRLGAGLARQAFVAPVDGTALSVLAAAAEAAVAAGTDKLAEVADAAVAGAAVALADTPRQLPVLAAAGVVDAGGLGVLLVLEAMASVAAEREPAAAGVGAAGVAAAVGTAGAVGVAVAVGAAGAGGSVSDAGLLTRDACDHPVVPPPAGPPDGGHEYEVMYLLDASTDERVAGLRAALARLGDSVAVVGDGGVWSVHVHCTDVGAAIEAGVRAGRPHRITVTRFADRPAPPVVGLPPRLNRRRAVVAVAAGPAVAELFRGEGVAVVGPVGDPQAIPAATHADLLAAIAGTRAEHVVVLPNHPDGTAVAEAAAEQAREAGQDVVVVPTASPVQGLAALAVHDPARRASADVVAMAEAAAATRCGELTIAREEALTWAGRCHAGEVLGLVDGEVVLIGSDLVAAACALVGRMLSAGGELVTALLGADAPDGLADALTLDLRRTHPEVELAVYRGGQAGPLLVGVE